MVHLHDHAALESRWTMVCVCVSMDLFQLQAPWRVETRACSLTLSPTVALTLLLPAALPVVGFSLDFVRRWSLLRLAIRAADARRPRSGGTARRSGGPAAGERPTPDLASMATAEVRIFLSLSVGGCLGQATTSQSTLTSLSWASQRWIASGSLGQHGDVTVCTAPTTAFLLFCNKVNCSTVQFVKRVPFRIVAPLQVELKQRASVCSPGTRAARAGVTVGQRGRARWSTLNARTATAMMGKLS